MRVFQIEESENSPRVWLDEKSGIIEISGVSAFRNPDYFYRSLARWIHAFNLGEHKTRMVNMRFDYLDKASLKGMETILRQLHKVGTGNNELTINWYYARNNISVQMAGLKVSGISTIPFNLVAA